MDKEQTIITYLQEENYKLLSQNQELEEDIKNYETSLKYNRESNESMVKTVRATIHMLSDYTDILMSIIKENCDEETTEKAKEIFSNFTTYVGGQAFYFMENPSELDMLLGRDK